MLHARGNGHARQTAVLERVCSEIGQAFGQIDCFERRAALEHIIAQHIQPLGKRHRRKARAPLEQVGSQNIGISIFDILASQNNHGFGDDYTFKRGAVGKGVISYALQRRRKRHALQRFESVKGVCGDTCHAFGHRDMLDTRHAVKGVSRDAVVEQQLFNVNPYVRHGGRHKHKRARRSVVDYAVLAPERGVESVYKHLGEIDAIGKGFAADCLDVLRNDDIFETAAKESLRTD